MTLRDENRTDGHPGAKLGKKLCAMSPNCGVYIPQWSLMCGAHWRLVPVVEKRRLGETLRRYTKSRLVPDYSKLRSAQAAAVEAVRQKLAGKGLKK